MSFPLNFVTIQFPLYLSGKRQAETKLSLSLDLQLAFILNPSEKQMLFVQKPSAIFSVPERHYQRSRSMNCEADFNLQNLL